MSLMTELGTLIKSKLNLKQDTLVSGTNIKTINDADIVGPGNIEIAAGSGGYSANVYLTRLDSSTVPAYRQISYTPQPEETQLTKDVNDTNEVLIESHIFDGDVNTTNIPAGEWGFHYYSKVDNISADSFIRFELFKRSAEGVETVLFSKTSKAIDNTGFELSTMLITQPSYDTLITDRIGIKVYANTTSASYVTVSLIVGNGRASYFTTPLQIRHSQIRARNEADSHPISAITGLTERLNSIDESIGNINSALDTINGEVI